MSLQSLEVELRIRLILTMSWLINNTAKILGYPAKSPGMPLAGPNSNLELLKRHEVRVPPAPDPNTLIEAVIGNVPKLSEIDKFWYESSTEGYYNFYIEHFRNVIFLPDWLSKWIQLYFDIGVDTAGLEVVRDTLFSLCVYFMFLVQFRTVLYFIITVNPYTRPWIYLVSLTDWIYDLLFNLGISRRVVVYGFPILPAIVNSFIGAVADSLNHLVFTMPFLPSERESGLYFDDHDKVIKHVLVFRYLPSLWIEHPIPNKIRQFWYQERPEILEFIKVNYAHFRLSLLPDEIIAEPEKYKILSMKAVSSYSIYSQEFIEHFIHKQEILLNSFFESIDKLV